MYTVPRSSTVVSISVRLSPLFRQSLSSRGGIERAGPATYRQPIVSDSNETKQSGPALAPLVSRHTILACNGDCARQRSNHFSCYLAKCARWRYVCISVGSRWTACYDQDGVITRKHKLTICLGVLVRPATSQVKRNNWYSLSSQVLPFPPPSTRCLSHRLSCSCVSIRRTSEIPGRCSGREKLLAGVLPCLDLP